MYKRSVHMKPLRYKCKRCGHEWFPRQEEKPRVCPKCRSFQKIIERSIKKVTGINSFIIVPDDELGILWHKEKDG